MISMQRAHSLCTPLQASVRVPHVAAWTVTHPSCSAHEAGEDVPMQGIVCISGTNRPDNYTARALGIVVEAFRHSHIDPLVFDARTLSLAFPGHPDPGDGERL